MSTDHVAYLRGAREEARAIERELRKDPTKDDAAIATAAGLDPVKFRSGVARVREQLVHFGVIPKIHRPMNPPTPEKHRPYFNEASVDRFINYVMGLLLGAMLIAALHR